MSKVWNFLLPDTGEHKFRVEGIGTKSQKVYLDGNALAMVGDQKDFTGPGNSHLELRQVKSPSKSATSGSDGWMLLVNGNYVEQYVDGKRATAEAHSSLRDLRNMPEGSYMISTGFDADSLNLNTIRRYKFIALGTCHEVSIAHKEDCWQVVVNGVLIERQGHNWKDNNGECSFAVPLPDGNKLDGQFNMTWTNAKLVWKYELRINHMLIEPSWIKMKGDTPASVNPPIIPVAPQGETRFDGWPREQAPEPEVVVQAAAPAQAAVPPPPDILPQGVSYDWTSGLYQANIRGQTGKFIFLGEFQTVDEAHQRYLEAVPIHCPDKQLVPSIPK